MNRRWLPERYQDEVIPPPRATPTAWIERQPDNSFAIAPGFAELDQHPIPVIDGEIIEFDWTEDHGRAEFTIHGDGSWTCSAPFPAAPEGGYMVVAVVGDWETMADDMETFAECLIDGDRTPRTETVVFYSWSTRSIPHEFRAGEFRPLASA